MGRIVAICTSVQKGTQKKEVSKINLVQNFGLEGDAHGGNWHRQVSLLSHESIEDFKTRGAIVDFGSFGENLIVEGLDFSKLLVGERVLGENFEMEITQIGKECHTRCKIYDMVGDCIMPKEGLFAKVIKGGEIKKDDIINIKEK